LIRIWPSTYEEASKRLRAKDPEVKAFRQRAKAANFGYPGGLGAQTFKEYARGYGIQMSIQDSYDLRSRWFARWPEMRRYLQEHIAGMAEYVETFPVTQFVSKRVRGGCYYTSAANTYFQGLAADGAKRALYDVSRACYTDPESPLYGSYPVVFVHDEIILETPEHAVHEAAEQLVGVMCASMQKYVPDIPITASAHAMRVWTKDAEPVYRDERLVPWERAA
jgi:DNA polymerase-1